MKNQANSFKLGQMNDFCENDTKLKLFFWLKMTLYLQNYYVIMSRVRKNKHLCFWRYYKKWQNLNLMVCTKDILAA